MTALMPNRGIDATSVSAHADAANAACEAFFAAHAGVVAVTCRAMASRFQIGGRLLVFGAGTARSDVAHVVVEFVHPVMVGKRALPAMALPEVGSLAALQGLGRPQDVFMFLAAGAVQGTHASAAEELLVAAHTAGMLVLALVPASFTPALTIAATAATGTTEAAVARAFVFRVPSNDADVVQEIHEMLYHVLWELVHVFLGHTAAAHD